MTDERGPRPDLPELHYLARALDNRSDVVAVVTDFQGRIQWVSNSGSHSLLRRPLSLLIDQAAIQFVHQGDRAELLHLYHSEVKSHGRGADVAHRVLLPNGDALPVRTVSWIARDTNRSAWLLHLVARRSWDPPGSPSS